MVLAHIEAVGKRFLAVAAGFQRSAQAKCGLGNRRPALFGVRWLGTALVFNSVE